MWKEETILGLLCLSFRKNLVLVSLLPTHESTTVIPACARTSAPRPRTQQVEGCVLIFVRRNPFQHSDFKINQALVFSFTSKTCKTGPTIMKKTEKSAMPWSQLPIFFLICIFYFYYLESGLILLFLSSNIWIIFSQKLGWVWQPHTDSGNV